MCKKIAREMLTLLETCDLWSRASTAFRDHASRDDCDGMMRTYTAFVEKRPDVGKSLQAGGFKPIEAVREELKRLHARHPER